MTLKIGELLVQENIITSEQLKEALTLQLSSPDYKDQKIGEILVSLGMIKRYKLIKYLVILGVYEGRKN